MSKTESRTGELGLAHGAPGLQSVGAIAFGPDGILFVADNAGAAVFALDVGSSGAGGEPGPRDVDELDARLAAYLGCAREDVHVRDLAVHPETGEVWLSVMRGAGAAAVPLLLTVGADGGLADVSLDELRFARVAIEDAPGEDDERQAVRVVPSYEDAGDPLEIHGITLKVAREPARTTTITDLAYVDGQLLVAGASNEEFVSTLRRIPFPFGDSGERSSLEIFHVSHGKYETHSPLRNFIPYDGGRSILASYTCTPVVRFSLDELSGAGHAKGRTVAELGPMNTPLDMIAYTRDGEEYLLVSNSRHPLLKLRCRDLDVQEGLTTPTEPVGPPRDELPHAGVSKMATADGHVLMLQHDDEGRLHLRSYEAASL